MAEGNRTERATGKKRRDERKKGHIPLSKDTVAMATLFMAYGMLQLMAVPIVEHMVEFTNYCFRSTITLSTSLDGAAMEVFGQLGLVVLQTVFIIALAVALCAVAVTFLQTRFLVSLETIKPKFSKLSPIKGFKNLFSLRSLVDTVKNLLKIILLIVVIYLDLKDMLSDSSKFLYTDVATSAAYVFELVMDLILKVGIVFGILAVVDIFYQRWQYERDMRMTKQEVKDEFKQLEGNPQIKSKIRQTQRRMAMSRMMQQVPDADVVIKNPTHYAVALRYKPEKDNAPVVLALGQDELALRIIKTAEEHKVAVIENVALARALYANTELGREIPPEFYGAVAEVLVYIFRLDDNKKIVK